MEHQKRARLYFKQQMKNTGKSNKNDCDLIFKGDCNELDKQSMERKKVLSENEDLQGEIDELNEDMAYGKQRENKLMFFLYILKQMGYPISEVFEREIKDVPTSRFSKNFDDEYKVMHAQLWKERKALKKETQLEKQNGFAIDRDEILIEQLPKSDRLVPLILTKDDLAIDGYSIKYENDDGDGGEIGYDATAPSGEIDMNFYPLHVGPTKMPSKPDIVPQLDINKVLVIKYRRAKGLSIADLIKGDLDSNDQHS